MTARKATLPVWAEQTAFELKFPQEAWLSLDDGSDGRPNYWFMDVDERAPDDENAFMRTQSACRTSSSACRGSPLHPSLRGHFD